MVPSGALDRGEDPGAGRTALDSGLRLELREMHPDAHVRTVRERDVVTCVLAADVEKRSGSGKYAGSRFTPASEISTKSPLRI